MPYNFLKQFKKACKHNRKNIIPWGGVLNDADDDFNIRTETQLYEFISHGGLENPRHTNTKPWEKNPKPDNPIMVFGYTFTTMCKKGYIAIMRNELTNKWIIKSFHRSVDINTNTSMQVALQKALIDLKGK